LYFYVWIYVRISPFPFGGHIKGIGADRR
jgi:hypothetical protein